jgi:hypothetical protein
MHKDVVTIHIDHDTLVLGRFGVFPREISRHNSPRNLLLRIAADPYAFRQLSLYWSHEFGTGLNCVSGHEVIRQVGAAIEVGRLHATVLPRSAFSSFRGQAINLTRPVRSSEQRALPQGRTYNVRRSREEIVKEVISRAATKVPGDIRAALLSLISSENIGIILGTIAFGAAANLTPYGWAADALIIAIAFGFGGLAAVQALGDLVDCFKRTSNARTEQDLDAAAQSLARAVVGLGVLGLMAVLHRASLRKGGGGGGAQSERIEIRVSLDEAKLKELAISTWKISGPDSLVKVVSKARGAQEEAGGYITKLKFIAGRTPQEIEKILGLKTGELSEGCYVGSLKQLPKAHQFELKGYTNTPDGKPYAGPWPVPEGEYPPGSGAPQWRLKQSIASTPTTLLEPGQKYSILPQKAP